MIDGLSHRDFQRRARLALRRMTPLQRDVFLALQDEHLGYPALAHQHHVTEAEVRAAFAAALLVFTDEYDRPPSWWRRVLQS
ncbi:hypothetical protein [Novosphingobium sp. P6W]|uniref:hypothetical protein n=1 Tax=Novosphingobium sp. P6W TaxID=1609758 RepID=UPI0005C2E453|nr:hypothetical protein [Novosphingobium sp. P6W]AXB80439.1 RNA polymerase subunit sigma [Novosphingobium sp. P6W]KIS31295.1 hypothetical protein TQ38_17460 [Novosphingobium sp. P6W]